MTTLSLRLPDSLHRAVKQLAKTDRVSINQFVASAVAEKTSALMTEDYLSARAAKGKRAAYEAVLVRVPKTPAASDDALPPGYKLRSKR